MPCSPSHRCSFLQVTVYGSTVSFSPTLPPTSASPASALKYLYIDLASTSDQKPTYRFTIPTGLFFDLGNGDSQTWYITLANMITQPPSDKQSYAIRATCMLSDQVGNEQGSEALHLRAYHGWSV